MCEQEHCDKSVKLCIPFRLMAKIKNNNEDNTMTNKTSLCQNHVNCISDLQSLNFLNHILQCTVMMMTTMIMIMIIIIIIIFK
jgi:hypothetical protein